MLCSNNKNGRHQMKYVHFTVILISLGRRPPLLLSRYDCTLCIAFRLSVHSTNE